MNPDLKNALKAFNQSTETMTTALFNLAKEACLTEDPHTVWQLINNLHTVERMSRQVKRRWEHTAQ